MVGKKQPLSGLPWQAALASPRRFGWPDDGSIRGGGSAVRPAFAGDHGNELSIMLEISLVEFYDVPMKTRFFWWIFNCHLWLLKGGGKTMVIVLQVIYTGISHRVCLWRLKSLIHWQKWKNGNWVNFRGSRCLWFLQLKNIPMFVFLGAIQIRQESNVLKQGYRYRVVPNR